jgi:hypothetical protein
MGLLQNLNDFVGKELTGDLTFTLISDEVK